MFKFILNVLEESPNKFIRSKLRELENEKYYYNTERLKIIESYIKDTSLFKFQEAEWLIIDYWATSCGPCIKSFPNINKQLANINEIRLVALCIDKEARYSKWKRKNNYPNIKFKRIEFDHPITKVYPVMSFPTYYIINRAGKIISGPLNSWESVQEWLGNSVIE